MRAVVHLDKILDISEKRGTVEIGTPPAGVGLERLRWDGEAIIDLATLTQIWVRSLGCGIFDLHATEQPGAQLIFMTYQDRKKLMIEDGIIRIKTASEIEEEKQQINIQMLKNRLRRRLSKNNGDVHDQIADVYKLVFMLIIYWNQPQVLADFFDAIIPNIKDVYDLNTVKTTLINVGKKLTQELPVYYQEKEEIKNPTIEATSVSAATLPK